MAAAQFGEPGIRGTVKQLHDVDDILDAVLGALRDHDADVVDDLAAARFLLAKVRSRLAWTPTPLHPAGLPLG